MIHGHYVRLNKMLRGLRLGWCFVGTIRSLVVGRVLRGHS